MTSQLSNPSLPQFWMIFTALFAFVTTVFWIIVGWRAMRAHERIASTLEDRMPR